MVLNSVSQHFCRSAIPKIFQIVSGGKNNIGSKSPFPFPGKQFNMEEVDCLPNNGLHLIHKGGTSTDSLFLEPEPKNWQNSRHWEILGSPRPIKHGHPQTQYFKAFLQLQLHCSESSSKNCTEKTRGATVLLKCIICQHMTKHSWIHFFISLKFSSEGSSGMQQLSCTIFVLLER